MNIDAKTLKKKKKYQEAKANNALKESYGAEP